MSYQATGKNNAGPPGGPAKFGDHLEDAGGAPSQKPGGQGGAKSRMAAKAAGNLGEL